MQRKAGAEDDDAAQRRAQNRERDRVAVEPERDDDEDDLEAFEEDALERDDEAEPVEAQAPLRARTAPRIPPRAGGR